MSYVMQITSHPLAAGTPNEYTTVALTSVNNRWQQARLLLFTSLNNYIKYDIVQAEIVMSSKQSEHERQWRDYRTANGGRPIRDFLLALPDEDRAAILEEQ